MFAATALAVPVAMAVAGFFESAETNGCQSPTTAIAPLLTAAVLSGVLATAALALGTVACARVPPPRSVFRKLGLALLGLPLILVTASFVVLLLVFIAG